MYKGKPSSNRQPIDVHDLREKRPELYAAMIVHCYSTSQVDLSYGDVTDIIKWTEEVIVRPGLAEGTCAYSYPKESPLIPILEKLLVLQSLGFNYYNSDPVVAVLFPLYQHLERIDALYKAIEDDPPVPSSKRRRVDGVVRAEASREGWDAAKEAIMNAASNGERSLDIKLEALAEQYGLDSRHKERE